MIRYLGKEKVKLPPFYPVLLFLWESPFAELSITAKMLYGMLLSRADLSQLNGWLDHWGRVYVIFTLEEVQSRLSCGEQKASAVMKELERLGLIERRRQGCGKPYQIFLWVFFSREYEG